MPLSLGGGEAHKNVEHYSPDFAFIGGYKGKVDKATRVPHDSPYWTQAVRLGAIKPSERPKIKGQRYFVKFKGKNPFTREVRKTKPANPKGWQIFVDFSAVRDDQCGFRKRPMTDWTNPKTGQTIKNAMWPGSGDSVWTPEAIIEQADKVASLGLVTIAHNNWMYMPTHAMREAYEYAREAAF